MKIYFQMLGFGKIVKLIMKSSSAIYKRLKTFMNIMNVLFIFLFFKLSFSTVSYF